MNFAISENLQQPPKPTEIQRQQLPTKDTTEQTIFDTLDINTDYLKLLPGLDVHEIRQWFYSAKYFIRTADIVRDIKDENQEVTMQIFQKTHWATIAWIDLVINLIKLTAWTYKNLEQAKIFFEDLIELKHEVQIKSIQAWLWWNYLEYQATITRMLNIQNQLDVLWTPAWNKIQIEKLVEDWQTAWKFQPILKIKWPYKYFAILESVYLWLLARATKIATNSAKVVKSAQWKPVFFFADRFDNFTNQQLDWYSAMIWWVKWVATDAHWKFNNTPWMWTMPHALIATYNWETKEATLVFAKKYPEVPTISLVDFKNDCATTAVKTAIYLKENWAKLSWIRLDTSGSMVDEWVLFTPWILEKYFDTTEIQAIRQEYKDNKKSNNVVDNSLFTKDTTEKLKKAWLTWVCPELVKHVREQLDSNGFNDIKIFVSWWFTAEKIEKFVKEWIPVDGFGVWSSLLAPKYVTDNWDFTADIVNVNWQPVWKIWRKEY